MSKYLIALSSLFIMRPIIAQETKQACVADVIAFEDAIIAKKYVAGDKPAFINYKVRSEDREGEIVQTEVKMYRDLNSMHFFSDLVDIYSDKSETFMVLKPQKVIMASSSPEHVKNSGFNDEFLELRRKFMKHCDVESCIVLDSLKGIKLLKLKVNGDFQGILNIETMTYKYDVPNKKVLTTTVVYNDDYKVKKMTITYLDFKSEVDYSFHKSRKHVLTSGGKLIEKYKGYEYVDDRNTK